MLAGPKPAGDLCASWSQTCVSVRVALPKVHYASKSEDLFVHRVHESH